MNEIGTNNEEEINANINNEEEINTNTGTVSGGGTENIKDNIFNNGVVVGKRQYQPGEFGDLVGNIDLLRNLYDNMIFYKDVLNLSQCTLDEMKSKYFRYKGIKRFCIPVIGCISSGKSTLLNYLCNLKGMLAVGDRVTTRFVCIIRHDATADIPQMYKVKIEKRDDGAFNFVEDGENLIQGDIHDIYEKFKENIRDKNNRIYQFNKNMEMDIQNEYSSKEEEEEEEEEEEKKVEEKKEEEKKVEEEKKDEELSPTEPEYYFLIIKVKIPLFEEKGYEVYGDLVDFVDIPGLDENTKYTDNFNNFVCPIFKNILFPLFINAVDIYSDDEPKKIVIKYFHYYDESLLNKYYYFKDPEIDKGFHILNKSDLVNNEPIEGISEDYKNNYKELKDTARNVYKIDFNDENFILISLSDILKNDTNNFDCNGFVRNIFLEYDNHIGIPTFNRVLRLTLKDKYNFSDEEVAEIKNLEKKKKENVKKPEEKDYKEKKIEDKKEENKEEDKIQEETYEKWREELKIINAGLDYENKDLEDTGFQRKIALTEKQYFFIRKTWMNKVKQSSFQGSLLKALILKKIKNMLDDFLSFPFEDIINAIKKSNSGNIPIYENPLLQYDINTFNSEVYKLLGVNESTIQNDTLCTIPEEENLVTKTIKLIRDFEQYDANKKKKSILFLSIGQCNDTYILNAIIGNDYNIFPATKINNKTNKIIILRPSKNDIISLRKAKFVTDNQYGCYINDTEDNVFTGKDNLNSLEGINEIKNWIKSEITGFVEVFEYFILYIPMQFLQDENLELIYTPPISSNELKRDFEQLLSMSDGLIFWKGATSWQNIDDNASLGIFSQVLNSIYERNYYFDFNNVLFCCQVEYGGIQHYDKIVNLCKNEIFLKMKMEMRKKDFMKQIQLREIISSQDQINVSVLLHYGCDEYYNLKKIEELFYMINNSEFQTEVKINYLLSGYDDTFQWLKKNGYIGTGNDISQNEFSSKKEEIKKRLLSVNDEGTLEEIAQDLILLDECKKKLYTKLHLCDFIDNFSLHFASVPNAKNINDIRKKDYIRNIFSFLSSIYFMCKDKGNDIDNTTVKSGTYINEDIGKNLEKLFENFNKVNERYYRDILRDIESVKGELLEICNSYSYSAREIVDIWNEGWIDYYLAIKDKIKYFELFLQNNNKELVRTLKQYFSNNATVGSELDRIVVGFKLLWKQRQNSLNWFDIIFSFTIASVFSGIVGVLLYYILEVSTFVLISSYFSVFSLMLILVDKLQPKSWKVDKEIFFPLRESCREYYEKYRSLSKEMETMCKNTTGTSEKVINNTASIIDNVDFAKNFIDGFRALTNGIVDNNTPLLDNE